MGQRTLNNSVMLAALLGCLVLVNVIGVRVFGRLDVTADRAYTLSAGTREALAKLDDSVTVTAYFTEKLPAPYSSNARYVRDLLDEYRSASKGKLAFEFVDPSQQETEKDKETKREVKRDIFGRQFREPTSVEKELSAAGIQPVEITVLEEDQRQTKRAYMGLVVRHGTKKETIPVVRDTNGLEYELTSLIAKVTRAKTPVIGVLQGHGEPGFYERIRQLYALLSNRYEVRAVDLKGKDSIEDAVDALLVVGPKTAVPPAEQKAIDQFLMKGKPVALFLDVLQVNLRSSEPPAEAQHGLAPMLATWGVTLGDKLVADVQASEVTFSEQRGPMLIQRPVIYPFIPLIKQLEGDSPVSKGLGMMNLPFLTSVSAKAAEGRTVTVLARSSPKSWLEGPPFNIDPRREWGSEQISVTGPYDLMVQVVGKVPSHFAAEAAAQASASSPGTPLLSQSQGDVRLVVVGGSSFLWDDYLSRSNQALALNIADWMLMDSSLLAMRSRNIIGTPLKADVSGVTKNLVKVGNVLGVPLLLVGFGFARWVRRASRRAAATAGGRAS